MHFGITLLLFFYVAVHVLAFGGSASDRAQADALFNTPQLLQVKIEISPEGVRSLRRQPRTYVPATINEGEAVYTNVLIRIRGSVGSFRPITDKPGLTLKIEKGARRFHGLKKFHLNNSVQGVFLREAHGQRNEGFSGDTDWKPLQQDFSIEENQRETVLVCEFVALKGEVLFDKDSLRLERLR